MTPLPEIDISSIEAAKKSLYGFVGWYHDACQEAGGSLSPDVADQVQKARLALENMTFKNAHVGTNVMRDAALREYATLKAMVSHGTDANI